MPFPSNDLCISFVERRQSTHIAKDVEGARVHTMARCLQITGGRTLHISACSRLSPFIWSLAVRVSSGGTELDLQRNEIENKSLGILAHCRHSRDSPAGKQEMNVLGR